MLPEKFENQISEIKSLFSEYKYMKKNKDELQELKAAVISIIEKLTNHFNLAICDLVLKHNYQPNNLTTKNVQDTDQFCQNCSILKSEFQQFLDKIRKRISTLEVGSLELSDIQKKQFYNLLLECIKRNDMELLEQLLNDNIVDVNYVPHISRRDGGGVWIFILPLIIVACEYSNFNAIKMLCNNNANLNIRVAEDIGSSTSPLWTVINKTYDDRIDEIIRYLLDNGASPNFVSNFDETPLNKVVDKCDLYKDMIVKYGADVNLKNALQVACMAGIPGNIKILLENNVNINIFDENGNSPLHNLVNKFDNNDTKEIKAIIDIFLTQGFDINVQNNIGNTILHQAVGRAPNVNIIKYLLNKGANINIVNNIGNTPFHYLMNKAKFSILTHLLNKGIIGEVVIKDGGVALSEIIEEIKLMIDVFLEHGFNINSQNNIGNTPLYEAIKGTLHINIIKHLLDRGAELSIHNNDGKNGIDLAKECQKEEIIIFITQYQQSNPNISKLDTRKFKKRKS